MPAVQNKAFPLAGLMCTLRGIAHAHEGKAGITVPANASSSFSRRGCRLSPTRFMVIAHQPNLVPGLASR